jgi:hypothetical protein
MYHLFSELENDKRTDSILVLSFLNEWVIIFCLVEKKKRNLRSDCFMA